MKKREGFNDLLIPIICVLCIAPFVIRLAVYSCGFSDYAWHSDDDILLDIYSYYRCYFLEIVSAFALVILAFRLFLYQEKTKPCRIFIPAVVYSVMALASAIFSVNTVASFRGNYYQFQSVGILIGYWLLCFYTYQILEKESDYKMLWHCICVVFVLMVVVGVFQVVKKDLLDFPWMQKLIMSEEEYAAYGGTMITALRKNNVYLTLCNSNYAGVFMTMINSVLGVMCYSEKIRWKKVLYGLATLIGLALMWMTYARSTLVVISIAVVIFLALVREKITVLLRYFIPLALGVVALFLLVDKANDFAFLSRMLDRKYSTELEEIITTKDGVQVTYAGDELLLRMKEGRPEAVLTEGVTVEQRWNDSELVLLYENPIRMFVDVRGESEYLTVFISDRTFAFGEDEDGYYYQTITTKEDQMVPIEKVDVGGLEYLGSGRIYIWSRTLPLLKDYMVIGSGADTFPEVFPQNDYVGKSIYMGTPVQVIEKPHNDYLLQWVQNGFLAFAAMVVFYIWVFVKGVRFYTGKRLESYSERLGMGCFLGSICYMIGSIFNDSTLYTTPIFWVFAGISLASTSIDKQDHTH